VANSERLQRTDRHGVLSESKKTSTDIDRGAGNALVESECNEMRLSEYPVNTRAESLHAWFRTPPMRVGESLVARRTRVARVMGAYALPNGSDTDDFLAEKKHQIDDEYSRYP
jgi:hypothetical protein